MENLQVHRMIEVIEPLATDANIRDLTWRDKLLEFACVLNASARELAEAQTRLIARRMIAMKETKEGKAAE
jgi:hypothetical protein